MKITKETVKQNLIKHGSNPEDADKLIEKNYAYAVRTYSKMKNICECLEILD